jgi:uncharacterized protein YutE (UPF0331/DUF86 family)
MTIDEKLKHIESALRKVREMAEGHYNIDTFSYAECDAIEAALEVAAGICTLFREQPRHDR